MLRKGSLALAFLAVGFVASAQEIPLTNWTVPQYSLAGPGKAVDATPPRAFIGLQPCRILDTRGNGAPITGGIFANSEARNYTITNICGLPAGADAVSVNFTVTGSPAAPPGAFLLAWPQGGPTPAVSTLSFQAGQTVSNAAIVPLSSAGQIRVNVSHATHVIMDVNGYFAEAVSSGVGFWLSGAFGGPGIFLSNTSANCWGGCGVAAEVYSDDVAVAILGNSLGSGNSVGVYGSTTGSGAQAAGVYGEATTSGAAGVYGKTATGGWAIVGVSGGAGIGVRGTSGAGGGGVVGIAGSNGVGVSGTGGAGGVGVYFSGGLAGTGTKSFIEPHPTDPALAIKYASLEGPEAGTYFRGRGKFQRGLATIEVPETFRMVTAEEGLSVQITRIGAMASFAVLRIDLDGIVVQASRDVEFFYTVNGVRRAYRNWEPIVSSEMAFRPESPEERLPDNLSEEERARLIANGTYTKDGKVNLETARKLGWDKAWRKK
jgi:hypothetical protein